MKIQYSTTTTTCEKVHIKCINVVFSLYLLCYFIQNVTIIVFSANLNKQQKSVKYDFVVLRKIFAIFEIIKCDDVHICFY